MATTRVLLPTHLFPIKHAEKTVYVVLDPVLFTGPDGTFKIHKAKLVYLITVAEEFATGRPNVKVVYPDDAQTLYESLGSEEGLVAYPPLDRAIEAKYRKFLPGLTFEKHSGFVIDPSDYDGALKLGSVYRKAREITGVLPNAKSMDKDNRHPPDDFLVESAKPPSRRVSATMKRAIEYVEKRYPDHLGNAGGAGYYPTTRKAALKRLRDYAKSGLSLMRYQDAIAKNRPFLGHSVLSAAINVGLLDPAEVCREIEKSDHSESDKEGFIRQILGWRELMRLHYAREPHSEYRVYKPPAPAWYAGTTGLDPLDDVIASCADTAYAHHINRLMVILNAFTLTNHADAAVYRWFMEMVAIDAYDWVMVSNISIMRHKQHKPYVSSSAYIVRMSTGFDEGDWKDRWDALFYAYIRKAKNPYFARVLKGRKYTESEPRCRKIAKNTLALLKP